MTINQHIIVMTVCFLAWLVFLLLGMPSNYYLEYSVQTRLLIVLATFLLFIPPVQYFVLKAMRPRCYFYSSVVFCGYATFGVFLLDYLYCGIYQHYGIHFLTSHWLQTAGYVIPWLEMPVIGYVMDRQ
jgi:hypothetical protein